MIMASASPSANASSSAARRGLGVWLCCALIASTLAHSARAFAQEPAPAAVPNPAPASAPNPADIKNQCADAYEATQRDRAAGHLLAARKAGIFCAQPSCPEVLRTDCAKWTSEASNSIPSLVIEARTRAGELLTEVFAQVDGAAFSDRLDGRSRELDPGRHHIHLEALGFLPNDSDFVVVEGHQAQRLSITLEPEPIAPPAPRPVPVAAYALGGVGVLGLASFTFFGLSGNHKKSELSQCQDACPSSSRAPIERDYLVADVSLGVSVVSFGVAAWLAFTSQKPAQQQAALDVRAAGDGVLLGYRRRF